MSKRIVIIGAGPTGLGAAYRLKERGYDNWSIYERNSYVGGHASSHEDEHGFVWDEGGHVIFSHYPYFDRLLTLTLGQAYLEHERQSWIRLLETWVPYPFQNNIRYLPPSALLECLMGLIKAYRYADRVDARNFKEWIEGNFGSGIANYFMYPYNTKVWAYPLEQMDKQWIGERVSVIDLQRVLSNVVYERDDVSWGPNNKFKFPLRGGTGEIYRQIAKRVESHLACRKELAALDLESHQVSFADGTGDRYDALISTIPLNQLVQMTARPDASLIDQAARLEHNSLFVVGIGLDRPIETKRCWLYFPEPSTPFYRMTYFHNYSPNNVPEGRVDRYSSLMCEVSFSRFKVESRETIVERTIQGLIRAGIIAKQDRARIVSCYLNESEYAYPIPSLGRDEALGVIQPFMMAHQVYSRGRFGAWKYEIGNMDHAVMMGVEAVDYILDGTREVVWGG
jgi:protoporphyrinogen oxidase